MFSKILVLVGCAASVCVAGRAAVEAVPSPRTLSALYLGSDYCYTHVFSFNNSCLLVPPCAPLQRGADRRWAAKTQAKQCISEYERQVNGLSGRGGEPCAERIRALKDAFYAAVKTAQCINDLSYTPYFLSLVVRLYNLVNRHAVVLTRKVYKRRFRQNIKIAHEVSPLKKDKAHGPDVHTTVTCIAAVATRIDDICAATYADPFTHLLRLREAVQACEDLASLPLFAQSRQDLATALMKAVIESVFVAQKLTETYINSFECPADSDTSVDSEEAECRPRPAKRAAWGE